MVSGDGSTLATRYPLPLNNHTRELALRVNHLLGAFAPASHLLVNPLFFNALEDVWLLKGTKLISHY